jgi:hypothetical protein
LNTYELRRKIVAYVKDEGFNLNTMIVALKSIVSCDVLGLEESFQGTCFDHAFFKMCQYATINTKSLQRLEICIYQSCPWIFAKVHNLAKKFKKRWARMGESMCQFKSSPKEIALLQ